MTKKCVAEVQKSAEEATQNLMDSLFKSAKDLFLRLSC